MKIFHFSQNFPNVIFDFSFYVTDQKSRFLRKKIDLQLGRGLGSKNNWGRGTISRGDEK